MPFEVFDRGSVPRTEELQISIQKSGVIAFNHAAFIALGEPTAAELLFDREARIIGIRPSDPSVKTAIRVRSNHRGTTHMLAGQRFTRYCGIPTDVARRWTATIRDGVLCVDLKEPGEEIGSRGRLIV